MYIILIRINRTHLVNSFIPFKSKLLKSSKPKLAQNKDCDVSHRFANLRHITQDSPFSYEYSRMNSMKDHIYSHRIVILTIFFIIVNKNNWCFQIFIGYLPPNRVILREDGNILVSVNQHNT